MNLLRADDHGPRSPHRSIVIVVAALILSPLAACSSAAGSPSPALPASSPTSAAQRPTFPVSPSTSPTTQPASADPASLRWIEGETPGFPAATDPGVSAATDPGVGQEFYVFGWSKGYLGFTSAYVKATGAMQSLLVTSSVDGLHWRDAGRLNLGSDDVPVIVTHVVEGPAGLLATAEQAGCAWQKPALLMWRSTDGATWTPIDIKTTFGADALPSVSAGSAGYIVLGASGEKRTVWTSRDGASWHKNAVPGGGFSSQSVASFQGGFILAGKTQVAPLDCGATTGGTVTRFTGSVWSSELGSPWTAAALPGVLSDTQTTMSVYRLNDTTVLVEEVANHAQGATLQQRDWTSSDGLTWKPTDVLAASLGDPLTIGTRTTFVTVTDQGVPEIRELTSDLRLVDIPAGADAPVFPQWFGLVALGPAGLVVSDVAGAKAWLGVPVR